MFLAVLIMRNRRSPLKEWNDKIRWTAVADNVDPRFMVIPMWLGVHRSDSKIGEWPIARGFSAGLKYCAPIILFLSFFLFSSLFLSFFFFWWFFIWKINQYFGKLSTSFMEFDAHHENKRNEVEYQHFCNYL